VATPSRIPQGIEVLVKKASVDPEFRRLLLARRSGAAREIELELGPAEAAMLDGIPAGLLEATIAQTVVSPMTRAAFLGRAAAAMLAALAGASGLAEAAGGSIKPGGISPDRPPLPASGFVLCEQTSTRGEVLHSLLDAAAFRDRVAQVQRTNRLLGQAHALASRAWGADASHKDVAFPLPLPQPIRCARQEVFADRQAGEAALRQKLEEDAKRAADARKAEEQRLAALSDAEREAEMKRWEPLRAAQQLFDDQLNKLVASGAALPQGPPTDGIRPDVPPAVAPRGSFGGVRPDRP